MFSFSKFVRDLKSIKQAVLWASLMFIGGMALGWFNTESLEQLLVSQLEGLGEISRNLHESSNPQLGFFTFIFFNNAIKGVAMIFFGALLGVLPALFLIVNGAVIGYLIHQSALAGQDLFTLIVKGLLPHGIIEIPAIVIACAFGLQFGLRAANSLFRSKTREGAEGWSTFMRQTLTASFWVVILLLAAAVIESTLTFHLMSNAG